MEIAYILYLVIALTYNSYSILTALGLYHYRNTEYMKHRNILNCAVFIIVNLYFVNFLILSIPYFEPLQSQIDCNYGIRSSYFVITPVWGFTFFFSVGNLVYKDRVSQLRLIMLRENGFRSVNIGFFDRSIVYVSRWFMGRKRNAKESDGSLVSRDKKIRSSTAVKNSKESPSATNIAVASSIPELVRMSKLNGEIKDSIYLAMLSITIVFGFAFMGVMLAIYGIHNCDVKQLVVVYCFAWILLAFGSYLISLAWYAQDNYHIRRNIFIHTIVVYPNAVLAGFTLFTDYLNIITQILGVHFPILIMYLSAQLTIVTMPLIHCYLYEILNKSNDDAKDLQELESIFSNPTEYEKFKKVIAADFCTENLIFYEEYKKLLKSSKTADVNKLYVNFVLPGSKYELNLPASLMEGLANSYAEKRLAVEDFEGVYNEVMRMMFANTYKRYLKIKG